LFSASLSLAAAAAAADAPAAAVTRISRPGLLTCQTAWGAYFSTAKKD